MNILITGGNGQLGQSINSVAGEYPGHQFFFTDLPQTDITDHDGVCRSIEKHNIDLIVNCAAYTAVDKAESEPELCERINVVGPRTLSRAAAQTGAKLIHISTDYVFSGEHCLPYRESDAVDPTGVYGRTKLDGERAVMESECDAAIIRTSWLYSEFGNNFVKTMLRVAAERDWLGVVYDQAGTPTYGPDLARAIMAVAGSGIEGREIYHYSNEGVTSWYDFAVAVFELTGVTIPVAAIETSAYLTPARRPAYSVLSKDKIKTRGAVVPHWRESLKICISKLNNLSR